MYNVRSVFVYYVYFVREMVWLGCLITVHAQRAITGAHGMGYDNESGFNYFSKLFWHSGDAFTCFEFFDLPFPFHQ